MLKWCPACDKVYLHIQTHRPDTVRMYKCSVCGYMERDSHQKISLENLINLGYNDMDKDSGANNGSADSGRPHQGDTKCPN
jgi:Zn ribbon nucleic-acid-binding protein